MTKSTNGQPPKDSIQQSKRELLKTLKRLSHADILRQFPNIVNSDGFIALTIPCLPPVNYWNGNRVSSNFGWRKHPLNGRFKHHNGSVHVQEGQFLQIGETIGILGNTGHSTGKHLHYAIKKNGQYVNPIEYLTLGLKFLEAFSQWK